MRACLPVGIFLLGFSILAAPLVPAFTAPNKVSVEAVFQARIEAPEAEVEKAVQQVIDDEIIHGTYSYEKERTLTGAHAASSSSVLGEGEAGTKAFYKIAENVLAPRYFKETGDIGTITVRYLLRPLSDSATSVQIDAVFVDARHTVHRSQGSVESAEYGMIQQHVRELQAMREQAQLASSRITEERQERANVRPAAETPPLRALAQPLPRVNTDTPAPATSSAEQDLEQRVRELRHKVELRVKGPGAPLKSAPFRSATTLQKLPAQAEVVVLILTPYWMGVETTDGQRGWIHRDQLEALP
jgi:hypothetical protein